MRNEYDVKSKNHSLHTHPYGAKEVCRAVGISHRQLDYWVLIGVVNPHLERHGAKLFRRFSRLDITVLQRIKQLIDEGVVVSRAAERVHREMASVSDSPRDEAAASAATPDGQETDAA
ncbi:MAG: MerR family transcriptional regulator [Nitrospirae bacterium]|nr:MerR family transcriptional regulator [Nitrospirota bacterium]